MEEQDEKVSLLERLVQHARATATYNVYFGRGRDRLRRSRTRRAREPVQRRQRNLSRPEHAAGLLAVHDLDARPRLGDARLRGADRVPRNGRRTRRSIAAAGGRTWMRCSSAPRARPAITTSTSPPPTACRTGTRARRGLRGCDGWRDEPPIRSTMHEPVDSSAAAIAAQGLLRLGHVLTQRASRGRRRRYKQAGLRVLDTLCDASRI